MPQSSAFSPILFLVFINVIDYVGCGNPTLQLLTDDAKLGLYNKVNVDNIASSSLQQSLDRLANWAKEWQLTININKCAVVSLSSSSHTTLFTYFIAGVAVPRYNSYFDLGITISSDLSFDQHINGIVSKAQQRVGILFRGFLSRNLSTMHQAFITYIRPVVE